MGGLSSRSGGRYSWPQGGSGASPVAPGTWVRTEYEVDSILVSPVTPQTPPSSLWSNYNQILFSAPVDVAGPCEIVIAPSIANGRWVVGVLTGSGSITVVFTKGLFATEAIVGNGELYWLVLDVDQGLKLLPIAPPEASGFEVFIAVDPVNDYSAEEGASGYVAVNSPTATTVYLPTDSPIGSEWVVQDVFGISREYSQGGVETQITIGSLAGQAINGKASVSLTQPYGALILFKDTASSWKVAKRSSTNILSSGEAAVAPGPVAADAYFLLMNTVREPVSLYLDYSKLDDGQVINIADDTTLAADSVDNLLTDSPQIDVPDWVIYGGVTDDGLTTGNGPDGVLKARALHIPASSGTDANVITNFGNVTATQNWVGSVWLRGTVGGEQVYLHVFTVLGDGASVLCNLTTEWQQFSVFAPFVAFVDNVYVEIGYDGSYGALTPIDACDIEAAYAHLEPGSVPSVGTYGFAATNPITIIASNSEIAPDGVGTVDVIDTNGGYLSFVYDKTNNRLVPIGASSTSGGGGGGVAVSSIADLVLLDDTGFTNGTQVWVETVQSYWRYQVEPAIVPDTDGLTIVEAFTAGNYWYRATTPDRFWSTVGQFFLNNGPGDGGVWGAGDDENDGLTALTPIASFGELTRRTFGGESAGTDTYYPYYELYIGPDGASGEWDLGGDVEAYGSLTVEATATVTAVNNFVRNALTTGQQTVTTGNATFWTDGSASNALYKDTTNNTYTYVLKQAAGVGRTKFFNGPTVTDPSIGHSIDRMAMSPVDVYARCHGRYLAFTEIKFGGLVVFDALIAFDATRCGMASGQSSFSNVFEASLSWCLLRVGFATLPTFGPCALEFGACVISCELEIDNGSTVTLTDDTVINTRVGGMVTVKNGRLICQSVEARGDVAGGTVTPTIKVTEPGNFVSIPVTGSGSSVFYGADNAVIVDLQSQDASIVYGDKTYIIAASDAAYKNWKYLRQGGVTSSGLWTEFAATNGQLPALTYVVQAATGAVTVPCHARVAVSCDPTGGVVTPTLPATPCIGDLIIVVDATGLAGTNAITITRAGAQTINGATTLAINVNRASYTLIYVAANTWVVV